MRLTTLSNRVTLCSLFTILDHRHGLTVYQHVKDVEQGDIHILGSVGYSDGTRCRPCRTTADKGRHLGQAVAYLRHAVGGGGDVGCAGPVYLHNTQSEGTRCGRQLVAGVTLENDGAERWFQLQYLKAQRSGQREHNIVGNIEISIADVDLIAGLQRPPCLERP